jgi:hypothetical protein
MDNILEPNSNFDFSKLTLGPPQSIQGGSYFTKLSYESQDVYIQFPKCKTKQGITQTEKKYQCDLLYETSIDGKLNEWLENLESHCQNLIYQKRQIWFNSDIDLNDIENLFNGCARLYKSGRQFLIRCHINKTIMGRPPTCSVYDEDENTLSFNDIDTIKEIIPLIKLDGIKFSTKNFQIEFNVSQIMILKERTEIKQCLIKINNKTENNTNNSNNIITSITENLSNVVKNNTELIQNKVIEEPLDLSFYKKEECSENDSYENESSDECLEEFEEIHKNEIENKNDNDNEIKPNKSLGKNEENKTSYNQSTLEINKNNDNSDNTTNSNTLDKSIIKKDNELELVDFNFNDITESIIIKKPNEVYYEIYKVAREKAKLAKQLAVEAFLEAQDIKIKYMLDDLDESDDDEIN